LVENFIVCHKDMWRHVVRPGSWHRSNRANAESTSCLERKVVFCPMKCAAVQAKTQLYSHMRSGVRFTSKATLGTSRFLENYS
jgi:hypothetical protein